VIDIDWIGDVYQLFIITFALEVYNGTPSCIDWKPRTTYIVLVTKSSENELLFVIVTSPVMLLYVTVKPDEAPFIKVCSTAVNSETT